LSKNSLNLSLIQKALVLVAVPLIFELSLLGALYLRLNETEREAELAERSKSIIAQTNSVVQLFFDATFALVALDARSSPYFQRHLERLVKRIPESVASLRQAVRHNPDHVKILDNVSAESQDAVSWVKQASVRSLAGERMDVPAALQMRQNLNHMIEELDCIIKDEQNLQKLNPYNSAHSKQTINTLIAFGIVMSVVIALLLVAVFHRSTARRLRTLLDNSLRLGQEQELAPLLTGNDEIARIDRTFHEAAVALRESAHRERALVDNAVDVICSVSAAGQFVKVNAAAQKLWGYSETQLVGKNVTELFAAADAERWNRLKEKLQESQSSGELENKVIRQDGSTVDMLWSCYWAAGEKSLFCVVHDITYRNELERLKQQFVSMISHDLRTPLSAVSTTLNLLSKNAWGQLNDQGLAKVAMAETNLRHSINLINNLLELDKMESGVVSLELNDFSLREFLERCSDAVAPLAEQRSVEINIPDLQLQVHADERRMSQVLINLLGNAVRFSPQCSSIDIQVQTMTPWVRVSVKDEGPGVPVAQQAQIFERFRQVEGADNKGGTGLGLAICKSIIDAHGAALGVDSTGDGNGSTFWFDMALAESAP
jgi:PAS domain S-box-containing protein